MTPVGLVIVHIDRQGSGVVVNVDRIDDLTVRRETFDAPLHQALS